MRLEIVEGFNRYFETKYPNKGHFVSMMSIESNKVIKALKTYTLELWHVIGRKKELVFSISDNISASVLSDNAHKSMVIKFTTEIFNKLEDIENKYGI